MPLTITAIAHRQASDDFIENGYSHFASTFPDLEWERGDGSPDVILFLSGGSELEAIRHLQTDRFTLLLAGFHDNAFAAAMEVKAWAIERNVPVMLLSLHDMDKDAAVVSVVYQYARVCKAFEGLQGKRAGLIGKVSHWLVASAVPAEVFLQVLGVKLIDLPWEMLPEYNSFLPDKDFLEVFDKYRPGKLEKEAGVHAFLKQLMITHRLDALTPECFDMANNDDVTACLSLALFNSEGIPAACEGDLVSLAGMMLAQVLTGQIPWMANVAAINKESVLFAHCTAPINMLAGVSVNTHFETDKSAAIQGRIAAEEVTVFRLNEKLNKAFVASGQVIARPDHSFACRTQTEISMDAACIKIMSERPLGNHHLILPGDQTSLLRLACKVKGIACF